MIAIVSGGHAVDHQFHDVVGSMDIAGDADDILRIFDDVVAVADLQLAVDGFGRDLILVLAAQGLVFFGRLLGGYDSRYVEAITAGQKIQFDPFEILPGNHVVARTEDETGPVAAGLDQALFDERPDRGMKSAGHSRRLFVAELLFLPECFH